MDVKAVQSPTVNFQVSLLNPQIPTNTGNIGRLCVATQSRLNLVHPLGFEIDDKRLKRAGLDYWPELKVTEYQSINEWKAKFEQSERLFFFSARAEQSFYDTVLSKGDHFVFGREADGLSLEIKEEFANRLLKIPFPGQVRSFNLANAVAMVLGEGIRQLGQL